MQVLKENLLENPRMKYHQLNVVSFPLTIRRQHDCGSEFTGTHQAFWVLRGTSLYRTQDSPGHLLCSQWHAIKIEVINIEVGLSVLIGKGR